MYQSKSDEPPVAHAFVVMYAVYLFLFLLHFFGAPLTPNSEYTSHHAHKHIIGYLPKLLSYTNLLRFLNTG